MFEFKGKQFDFDPQNPDDLYRYEKASETLAKEQAKAATGKSGGKMLEDSIMLFDDFLNTTLGGGTTERLFGDTKSFRDRSEAALALKKYIQDDWDGVAQMVAKFTPIKGGKR